MRNRAATTGRALSTCATMAALCCLAVGCASPTTAVEFRAPAGSRMTYDGKRYDLPAVVPLTRPGDDPKKVDRADVLFTFITSAADELPAEGVLEVFGYDETDVDRLSANTCEITENELQQLVQGFAVVFEGTSASKQPIYRLTIGMKR